MNHFNKQHYVVRIVGLILINVPCIQSFHIGLDFPHDTNVMQYHMAYSGLMGKHRNVKNNNNNNTILVLFGVLN